MDKYNNLLLHLERDQNKLKLLEKTLMKSNKNFDKIANIASFDLSTPLRAIERLASWIAEDNQDKHDEESKKNLVLLRQNVREISHLIEGILEHSRAGLSELDIQLVDTTEPRP